jgi:hypothetical protein
MGERKFHTELSILECQNSFREATTRGFRAALNRAVAHLPADGAQGGGHDATPATDVDTGDVAGLTLVHETPSAKPPGIFVRIDVWDRGATRLVWLQAEHRMTDALAAKTLLNKIEKALSPTAG